MEQQTVTIAKAGIHASLNARCSVVAAANPVYGQYDKSKRPQENIGLPDSLLSRFDLLFIVLDQLDSSLDRRLSEHVIKSHQYRRPGTIMEPEPLNSATMLNLDEETSDAAVITPVWQRNGGENTGPAGDQANVRPNDHLNKEFLRKYIHYARSRIHPVLSEEAAEMISTSYTEMRLRQNTRRNLPITARTLETIIRLGNASAKSRLSNVVEGVDVEEAIGLLNYVLFHEVGEEFHTSEVSVVAVSNSVDQGASFDQADENIEERADSRRSSRSGEGNVSSSNSNVENNAVATKLQGVLVEYRKRSKDDAMSMSELMGLMGSSSSDSNEADIRAALAELEQDNKVWFISQYRLVF